MTEMNDIALVDIGTQERLEERGFTKSLLVGISKLDAQEAKTLAAFCRSIVENARFVTVSNFVYLTRGSDEWVRACDIDVKLTAYDDVTNVIIVNVKGHDPNDFGRTMPGSWSPLISGYEFKWEGQPEPGVFHIRVGKLHEHLLPKQ